MLKKIACFMGTRPEVIKMAPVVSALQARTWADVQVVSTGQHRSLLDQACSGMGIVVDTDLATMTENQSLAGLTARVLERASNYLLDEKPDMVVVQGDTASVLAVAMASFYLGIPIAHVEAGLRTYDLKNPFPEEFCRTTVSRIAQWHFAPTSSALDNLLREGVDPKAIFVTGNTCIDALFHQLDKVRTQSPRPNKQSQVLITCHRRESFGPALEEICQALLRVARRNPGIQFVFPVHPNPRVSTIVHEKLALQDNIRLCPPMDYADFVQAMDQALFIVTDSGGVQEEAPALGKPVLVLREQTERPDAVTYGVAKLVGTNAQRVAEEIEKLIHDPQHYAAMARGSSPYGDGRAASRICQVLESALGIGRVGAAECFEPFVAEVSRRTEFAPGG